MKADNFMAMAVQANAMVINSKSRLPFGFCRYKNAEARRYNTTMKSGLAEAAVKRTCVHDTNVKIITANNPTALFFKVPLKCSCEQMKRKNQLSTAPFRYKAKTPAGISGRNKAWAANHKLCIPNSVSMFT